MYKGFDKPICSRQQGTESMVMRAAVVLETFILFTIQPPDADDHPSKFCLIQSP
jgi:hypothetical protein